jgi:glutathione S-transferase
MADVIFGGTLRFMLTFKTIEARPSFTAYADRLAQRPGLQKAEARNAAQRAPARSGLRACEDLG